MLREVSDELATAMTERIPSWVERAVRERAMAAGVTVDETARARIAHVGDELARSLADPLRAVLTADVDAGAGTPLATVRAEIAPVTAILDDLGVRRSRRDDFSTRHFPLDHHDLGPASFADIDESLLEPGLRWGAARAHVHLRRRRVGP